MTQQTEETYKEQIATLKKWIADATKIYGDLDLQEIGKEMGLTVGDNISAKILPFIKDLKAKLAEKK